jgi:hypothetical protein
MNQPQNSPPRKQALITAEQENLLHLFNQIKKMEYGELILCVSAGRITRYEIKRTGINSGNNQTNMEMLEKAKDDMTDFETVAV